MNEQMPLFREREAFFQERGQKNLKVIDTGHRYLLDVYDGEPDESALLIFMKRQGDGYPGNDSAHAGVNCQEVLRALIDRVQYLDNQITSIHNADILHHLREALLSFELRAAKRHGVEFAATSNMIEIWPTCRTCGHIACAKNH